MRTLGLIGGMSWESTALYYRAINEGVRDALGPLRSAPLLIYSYDFGAISALQAAGRWDEAGDSLADAAARLETAGAEAVILATNTMHKVAPAIETRVGVPLLHIGDCTAAAIRAAGLERVALLGTRFTMQERFYRDRLAGAGIETLVPVSEGMEAVHRTIYEELCAGVVRQESRARFVAVIEDLAARGAEGVILGCTEITLLVGPGDVSVPTFDTTAIHAKAAVEFVLSAPRRAIADLGDQP